MNEAGWCETGGNPLLSGGWAVGYHARRRCRMARVVVATRCAALEGDGGRREGMTAVS